MPRLVRDLAAALTVVALAGGVTLPAVAAAQAPGEGLSTLATLRPGDTVRVWSAAPRLARVIALVDRVQPDTLALRDLPRRRVFPGGAAIAVPALTRLEVRRGHRRSAGWAVTGVLLGLAGGAIVGAYTGVALECGDSCGNEGDLEGLAGFVIGGGLGALAGAITGGIIGAQRRPRWEPVNLPAR